MSECRAAGLLIRRRASWRQLFDRGTRSPCLGPVPQAVAWTSIWKDMSRPGRTECFDFQLPSLSRHGTMPHNVVLEA